MGQARADGTRVAGGVAAYNRRELTLACVHSLRAQHGLGATLDAFVLDGPSTGSSSDATAEWSPDVTALCRYGKRSSTGRLWPSDWASPGLRPSVRTLMGCTPRRARRAGP